VTEKKIEFVEIYPNIFVYKNMFKDIKKSYSILKESTQENKDRLFNNWTPWYVFGEYLNPIIPMPDNADFYNYVKNLDPKTETQKNHKDFAIEMIENFLLVTNHYIKINNVDVDLESNTLNEKGQPIPTWTWTGNTVGKYNISKEEDLLSMSYHSDYIREQGESPGYKFVITCTIYYNDDYDGGEVDFYMGGKLIKYKPEAGDLLVFPSGHPSYLTENDQPYLHGVMKVTKNNKYLSRMYWQKYEKGSDNWYQKEKEFGKEVWAGMQKQLEKDFRDAHPNKFEWKNGVRLK
jgi:hypothetical protein